MQDTLTAEVLARAQFAFAVTCQTLFPSLAIGLARYLAVLEGLWLATRRRVDLQLFRYWAKIDAASIGTGVVSGLDLVVGGRPLMLGLQSKSRADRCAPRRRSSESLMARAFPAIQGDR